MEIRHCVLLVHVTEAEQVIRVLSRLHEFLQIAALCVSHYCFNQSLVSYMKPQTEV
jgi:hypothetical protein